MIQALYITGFPTMHEEHEQYLPSDNKIVKHYKLTPGCLAITD